MHIFYKYSLFVLLVSFCSLLSAQSLPANVPTNGLMAFYTFSGNANDVSGNGNNAVLDSAAFNDEGGWSQDAFWGIKHPSLVADRFGNANSAYLFHGGADIENIENGIWHASWMTVPNSASLAIDTAITISFWMLQSSFDGMNYEGNYSSNYGSFSLISKAGDGYDADPGFAINSALDYSRLNLSVVNSDNDFPEAELNGSSSVLYDCYHKDKWVHCVVVLCRKEIKIYINGVLMAYDIMPEEMDFSAANNQPLYFGRMGGDPWIWYPYNGVLDDIGLWNRPLSDGEVAALYDDFQPVHDVYVDSYDTICHGMTSRRVVDTLLYENFEKGVKSSWKRYASDGAVGFKSVEWMRSGSYYYTPLEGSLALFEVNKDDYYHLSKIVTDSVNIIEPESTYVYFTYTAPAYDGMYVDEIDFAISSTNDGTFDPTDVLWAINDDEHNMFDYPEWYYTLLPLNDIDPGTKYFVFQHQAYGGVGVGIDEVLVYGPRIDTIPLAVSKAEPGATVDIVTRYGTNCGYDSIVTTHWYVKANASHFDTIAVANTYTLGDKTYNTVGVYDVKDTVRADNGCDSVNNINLTIYKVTQPDTPDNVYLSDCSVYPDGDAWTIAEYWKTDKSVDGAKVANQATPFVGDIDNDGHVEIVCFGIKDGEDWGTAVKGKTILVFDASTHALKTSISLPTFVSLFEAAPYGILKLKNGKGLIVVAGYDYKLYAFDITSANPSTPYWISNHDYGSATGDWACNISFADIDNDGTPEVIVRDKVYDAATGILLAQRKGEGSNFGQTYAHYTHQSYSNWQLSSPCVANILVGDNQEIILGNEVYTVSIVNHSDSVGNRYTLARTVEAPDDVVADGHAQVADFNLDGNLDILISNRSTDINNGTVSFYVWDIANNSLSSPVKIPTNASGKSFPLIADIDNDGALEVVIQCAGTDQKGFRAYKYNIATNDFSLMWVYSVDEDSYANAATCFDFNQDGKMELLICDQKTVHVVNGSGKSHATGVDTLAVYPLSQFDYVEVTIMQYPVIADIDNDNHAEFVSVGSNTVNVFRSAGVPWAPARSVWNQYLYNVTNVNNDLTIPQYYYSNASQFVNDAVVRRPYNNFLQQATAIDTNGKPFYAVADVADVVASGSVSGDNYVITINYSNAGAAALADPYYITLYADAVGPDTIARFTVSSPLAASASATKTFNVPLSDIDVSSRIIVSVNDSSAGVAQNGALQPECNVDNNSDTILYTSDSHLDTVYVDTTVCDTFYFDSKKFYEDSLICKRYQNSKHEDSLVAYRLVVKHSSLPSIMDTTVCDKFVWTEASKSYTNDAIESYAFKNVQNCDSVVKAIVHVKRTTQSPEKSFDTCTFYTWPQNGKTYTASQHCKDTIYKGNRVGCDSIVRLNLTIYRNDTSVLTKTACDSFLWESNNSVYRLSANDTLRYSNIHRCDSASILNLVVNYSSRADTLKRHDCDRFVWVLDESVTIYESGFYKDTIRNAAGCDSLVYLELSITSNSYADTTYIDTCDYFFWPQTGKTYTASGLWGDTLTNYLACDSIVPLSLTLRRSTSAPTVVAAFCDSYKWNVNQIVYDSTDLYLDTIRNAAGCDSAVALDLKIYKTPALSVNNDTTINICGTASLYASGAHLYIWSPATDFSGNIFLDSVSKPAVKPRNNTVYTVNGYNLGLDVIRNGDFSQGNVEFQSDLAFSNTSTRVGAYAVLNYAAALNGSFNGRDHTDGSGNFMMVDDAEGANSLIWYQEVEVQPFTDYVFSFWGVSLTSSNPAQLVVEINGQASCEVLELPSTTGQWSQRVFVWNSRSNSSARIRIVNQRVTSSGNDFGIDDIVMRPMLCGSNKTVRVNVHYDTVSQYVCDAYTWRETGLTYSQSGVYERHTKNAAGCDSVRRLDLHISKNFVDTTYVTTCNRYKWKYDTAMLTVSGLYKYEVRHVDVTLCDTFRYLRLTILDCEDVPLPDNVDDPFCTTPPPANAFGMKTLFTYGNNAGDKHVNSMSTPMAGDVDGDGVPELVVCRDNNGNPWTNNGFLIIDGRTGALKYEFTTAAFDLRHQAVTLCDGDNDGVAELYLIANDKYLYCYSAQGYGQRWRTAVRVDDFYMPMSCDINGDGRAEIACGSHIFDATTGTLLLKCPLQSTGMGYGAPHCDNYDGRAYYMQALVDIDYDNQLEICAGNTIYKPVITNTNGTDGNTFSVLRQAEHIDDIKIYDGQTFIADFDNDGDADVCVIGYRPEDRWNTYVYVWEGQSSEILAYIRIPLSGNYSGEPHSPSVPFCGDLDGNGTPEIIFNHPCGMFALSYTDTLVNGIAIMHNRIQRFAETAGFTVFDFNQDGKNEIVYRNTGFMVIVDGTTLQDLCPQLTTYSGTICEYPIVADIDADGHAEIIVNSANAPWGGGNSAGRVTVFASQQVAAWGSARSVWNQWAYSSVNINEDMTVPRHQFDVSTTFPNGEEPFNGFLRQSPHLDQNGNVYVSVSNLDAATSRSSINYTDSGAWVSVDYCNLGDNNLLGPYNISIYEGRYRGTLVDTFTVDETIYIDSCHQHLMFIPMSRLCHIHTDSLAVVLNDGGEGIGQNGGQQFECDTTNNVIKVPFIPVVPKADTTDVVRCDTYIWSVIDQRYNNSGLYSDTILDAIGCDSVRWLNLTINKSFADTTRTDACNEYLWPINNIIYNQDADVMLEYRTIHDCDSVHILILKMHYDDNIYDTVKACDQYYWEVDRRTYKADIVHTESRVNRFNCDSMITLVLSIYHSHCDSVYDTICQGGVRSFGNIEYTESGHYYHTIEQIPGCDTVHELFLTVKPLIPALFDHSSQCDKLQYTLMMRHPDMDSGTYHYHWTAFPEDDELSWQKYNDTIMIHPKLATVYSLTLYYNDNHLCPNTNSLSFVPTQPVHAHISTTINCFTPELTELRATAEGSGFTHQNWFVDNDLFSTANSFYYHYDLDNPKDSVVIALRVFNGMCSDSDTVVLQFYNESLFVPSVFSPSEERIKSFRVQGSGILEYEIFIYNRKGILVFTSKDINQSWDGRLSDGNIAPQAAYVYAINYRTVAKPNEIQNRTGTVTLIR